MPSIAYLKLQGFLSVEAAGNTLIAIQRFAGDEDLCVSDIDERDYFRKGNRYSLSDIIDDYLKIENQYNPDYPVELYDATYAYIDCGMDEKIEMAVNLKFGTNGCGDYSQRWQ